jgi:hypothetical protein
MDEVRLQAERATTQAELAALELRVYDLIKDLARDGRAPDAQFFAEAGFTALGPRDHIGWAYQRMRLAVPAYESNLAEFAGLMRSKTETYWTIQPGAPMCRRRSKSEPLSFRSAPTLQDIQSVIAAVKGRTRHDIQLNEAPISHPDSTLLLSSVLWPTATDEHPCHQLSGKAAQTDIRRANHLFNIDGLIGHAHPLSASLEAIRNHLRL